METKQDKRTDGCDSRFRTNDTANEHGQHQNLIKYNAGKELSQFLLIVRLQGHWTVQPRISQTSHKHHAKLSSQQLPIVDVSRNQMLLLYQNKTTPCNSKCKNILARSTLKLACT